MRIRSAMTIAVVLTVVILVVPVNARTFERRSDTVFAVDENPNVYVETVSGHVSVERGSTNKATVRTTITVSGADDDDEATEIIDMIDIEVESTGDEVSATVEYPRKFWNLVRRRFGRGRSVHVDFHLTVPAESRLDLGTVSGDVRAADITGDARLSTVSGNVDGANLPGRLRATSVSGDVMLNTSGRTSASSVSGDLILIDATGECDGQTTSGNLTVRGGRGLLEAKSVSGRIRVENHRGGFAISNTSGDVHVQSGGSNGEDMYLKTISGDIELELAEDDGCEFDLRSFSGDLEIDGSIKNLRSRKSGRVFGTVGQGGAELEASTTSGDIILGLR